MEEARRCIRDLSDGCRGGPANYIRSPPSAFAILSLSLAGATESLLFSRKRIISQLQATAKREYNLRDRQIDDSRRGDPLVKAGGRRNKGARS
jgi:hypothetical protein